MTRNKIDALITKAHAAKKNFRVVTRYADGRTRTHDTATMQQAQNYAVGERRRIGVATIDRDTNATVRVKSVEIVTL